MLNFGSALSYRSLPDIPDVFQAVEKGECDYGVVPIENSTEGAVNRSLDLLVDTELTIIAQVYLKIEHCLFSPSSLDKIVEVRSKDQALAQCGEWLRRNLPNARLIPVTSTAEAVRESAEGEGIAAIAGKLAGEAHGVPMLDSGIQDRKDNVTRFLGGQSQSICEKGWCILPYESRSFPAGSGGCFAVLPQSIFLTRDQPMQDRVASE